MIAWIPLCCAFTVPPVGVRFIPVATRTPPPVLIENPLAKLFGGDKKAEPTGGALSNGVDSLLKDAPLPVKILGGLVKPLLSGLETALEEQAEASDALLSEAQSCLRADARVAELIGENVQVGAVFSSMSSSSSVNGMMQKSVQLQAQCTAAFGSGVVAIRGESEADRMRIRSLQFQAGGRVIDVPTIRGGGGGFGGGGGATSGSDVVIDI